MIERDPLMPLPPEPRYIRGIKCYAPDKAHDERDYPADAFAQLAALQDRNFWFRSRNRIIVRMLRKYLRAPGPTAGRPKVLEIGCGTGCVLRALAAENRYELTGAEMHIGGLTLAKGRLAGIELVQLDARDLPYVNEFDAIGAFDVLEHIDDDAGVIRSVRRALVPDGLFFVTVPQHPWLWSRADDHARHKRRYSRAELIGTLEREGFAMEFCSSFVFVLLPLMSLSRLRRRSRPGMGATGNVSGRSDAYDELALPGPVNATLETAMRLDEFLIARGVSLPAGGSLLAVARKAAD
ncbi:MAG: class I SAM-dependent methyltransferase [Alphaproteobacteria bacterium]